MNASRLAPGLYRLHWTPEEGGGSSLAVVMVANDGGRWFLPANWTADTKSAPPSACDAWETVDRAEPIDPALPRRPGVYDDEIRKLAESHGLQLLHDDAGRLVVAAPVLIIAERHFPPEYIAERLDARIRLLIARAAVEAVKS